MQKRRIMNCITGLNIGGAEFMLVRYLENIDRARFESSVISLLAPGVLKRQIGELGVPLAALGMLQSQPKLSALVTLRRQITSANPDLVHGWMYHGNLAASLGTVFARKRPVIWSIHHSLDDIRNENRMTRWLIRFSAALSGSTAAIIYCSSVSAEQHEKLGFDPSKRVIIPNGIDCDVFKPSAEAGSMLRALLGIPAQRLIIGNAARAHPMKDHANLVRAADLLLKQGMDIQLLIIGAGHEAGEAKRVAGELGIADRVSYLGPRNDVHALLAGIDIYASSSAWGEAFPLAVAEAMSCGIPAVATRLGDCAHLIGVPEGIVPPRDPHALASALAGLGRLSREDRVALGLRGRDRVLRNFSMARYVARHATLYEQALEMS
jgi:glycosyltransferase involved in cell wall biosynthesis